MTEPTTTAPATTLHGEPTLLMRASEAREHLQISKSFWCRLRAQGLLPEPVKIAGLVRWRRRDIEELAEKGVPRRRKK